MHVRMGGIIGRIDDRHTGKFAVHVAGMESMSSQNECVVTQNEAIGLTPGQGFKYAAEKVDLF
jgi:hypothetical protein